jgi:hypothetical protein
MPPPLSASGGVRSAAVVNAEIRALWLAAGGVLSVEQRALYGRLLVEWEQAVRAEGAEAA